MRLIAGGGLGLILLTCAVQPAWPATVSWKNPVNGNWTDATKWDAGLAPIAGDDVIINASGSFTVTVNTIASVASVTLGATTGSAIQTLSVVGGGTLLPSSASVVNATAVLQLSGGTLAGAGDLTVDGHRRRDPERCEYRPGPAQHRCVSII